MQTHSRPTRLARLSSRTTISLSIMLAFSAAPAFAQDEADKDSETQLVPVVVTSTRIEKPISQTPASISLVTGEQMRGSGNPQINLSEALSGVPGLLIQNRQNYAQDLQISLRGFGSRSTFGMRGMRMYIDGIPATMPDGQGQSSNVDIASIDRIEVLKGPFSSLYGNSSGGVVQVFTAPGEGPLKVGGTYSVGSNGTHRYALEASGGTDNQTGLTDYRLSTSKFDTDGYRNHSSARKYLGNARLGFRLDEDSTLTFTANTVDIKADDPLALTQALYNANPRNEGADASKYNTRKTVKQTQAGLTWNRHINADNDVQMTTYAGTRHTVQYLAIAPGTQIATQTHSGAVIDLERQYAGMDARWTNRTTLAGRAITVVGGVAYDWLGEDRKGYENFTGPSNAPTALGVQGKLRRDERNKAWNLDPYVQASWDFADRWSWDAGLRYTNLYIDSSDHYLLNGDDSGSVSYHKLLPVTGIHFAATPDLDLYATLGRGFESPTFNELSYRDNNLQGLNFELNPSVNTNLEFGAKAVTAFGNINTSIFQTWTRDEIGVSKNSGGRTTYKNIGNTKRQGFEFAWDKSFARHAFAQVAYTWMKAKVNQDDTTIPGIAKHMLFGSVGWAQPEGWQGGAEWRFMDSIYATSGNDAYAPAYSTTALYGGYKFKVDKWEVGTFARVDNLFDRNYIGSVVVNDQFKKFYEPAPGRNWTLSVSANYRF